MDTKKVEQVALFDMRAEWEKEWHGMPEYVQNDLTSFRQIIVHFRCREDVDAFAKLIDQHITPRQPSLWYPKLEIRRRLEVRYDSEP